MLERLGGTVHVRVRMVGMRVRVGMLVRVLMQLLVL